MAWHLAALCIALAVPILAVESQLAMLAADAERARTRDRALGMAKDVAATLDRELTGLVATTTALSLSPHLQTGDLASFDLQARIVYRILGINVVLRDRHSQQLVNTRVERGRPLPTNVDIESDRLAMETKQPVVSNLFNGAITGKPLFIVNVPVLVGQDVAYLLNLSVDPGVVRDILLHTSHSSDVEALLVVDRNGKVVAGSDSQEAGRQLPEGILAELKHREGIAKGLDPNDVRRQAWIASTRSKLSGWAVMVVVPDAQVGLKLGQLVLGIGNAGAMMLALSLGLAVAFSRRVGKSVGALAAQAALVGRGQTVTTLSTPVREVNLLSAALSEAGAQRMTVEAALRSSEERLRLAQSAGRIGTWDWDGKSGRVTCSESYCRLYGLDPAGPGHRSVEEWMAQVHPDDRAQVARARAAGLAAGHVENEYRIVRRDGSIRWVVDRATVFYDAAGEIARIVGANVDVTESRSAAEHARELQFELLHASRLSTMGQMAASLAHELNQPLGAAANFLGSAKAAIAADRPEARARAEARMDSATEQLVRAGAIVRRLRDFVHRGETEKVIASPRKLIEEAIALALVDMKDRKVSIRYEFDPNEQLVLVDRIQIEQVLFNLVRNAIEAMEMSERREVVLATRATAAGQVEFSVADTGSGLPADTDLLFKPFASTKPNGMGLGLSICRTIIEAHGGRLWAEPNPGRGAVFRFVVSAAQPAQAIDGRQ